jgi:hypothetical protein
VEVGVVVAGGDEVANAFEDAAANSLVGEVAEPAFDEIEPTRTRRREVDVEARMTIEPANSSRNDSP